jgi:mRNA interferase HicA
MTHPRVDLVLARQLVLETRRHTIRFRGEHGGVLAVLEPTYRRKGSHGTLYCGERFTVVKDGREQCGPGLLNKMLADLG